jgi:hypothetical protein
MVYRKLNIIQEDIIKQLIQRYEGSLRNYVFFELRKIKKADDLDSVGDNLIKLGNEMKQSAASWKRGYEKPGGDK